MAAVPVPVTIRVHVAAPLLPPVQAMLAPPAEHPGQGVALPATPAPVVSVPPALPSAPNLPPAVQLPEPSIAPPPPKPLPAGKAAASPLPLPAVPAPLPPARKARRLATVSQRRQESAVAPTPPTATPAVSPSVSTVAPTVTASASSQGSSADIGHSMQEPGASTMPPAHTGGPAMTGGSGRTDGVPGPSAAGDTAPRLLHRPKPAYPWLARQRGFEGRVTLSVELLADGTVGQIKVLMSSGYSLLDKAAEEAAKSWKHAPALQNGVAVTRWARQVIDFRLDE